MTDWTDRKGADKTI